MIPNTTNNISSFQPKVLIVGTGAIGSYYGGKLAQGGAHVSAVCRSDYEKVKNHGIYVESVRGDFHFIPEKVVRSVDAYGDVPDYILVATKVVPEADVPKLIKAAIGEQTAILLIQNGIEIEEPVASAFPNNEVISGLAFIAVSRVGPGHIRHQDYGRLTLGCYPSGVSEKAENLSKLFEKAGIPCDVTPDVVTARWKKLVWNASFNPVSVLGGGVDTQTMLNGKESSRLLRKVMEEICLVAKAVGHELPHDIVQTNIDGTLVMKPYKTSMLLDFEAGRPMEVEAILGNAVRAAERSQVAVPHLESLYALLKMVDQKNRRTF
ncbi:2-dehydropantoate 2-reductase [Desulforhabdus amnigena]|jgi:2-dehydropantoate 2-reductase|uniref:2-dehydropantoate 2-reductase n=1 Tax=Desulforhabdus amnigena TaxID=40218 RepID=A0A9W6CYN7_9BACT|nr:2-dehydropantoate 2-reductase [Desulforhabdus amnigena]NLJ29193.1 2-dehydropantoate 2-reductase [Deltaproteobacteria bacterium]GLI32647.1 2-dehydropantoate 2-reductase [Desulforhabdus amnigena]